MIKRSAPARLIVNADDYGYFPNVKKSSEALAASRSINSVGVLVTAECLDLNADSLYYIDPGVHLSLSHGRPLTGRLANHKALRPIFRCCFPLLRGSIGLTLIRKEWATQIERVLEQGKTVNFLNSHQHIDMLPPLLELTLQLANGAGLSDLAPAIA